MPKITKAEELLKVLGQRMPSHVPTPPTPQPPLAAAPSSVPTTVKIKPSRPRKGAPRGVRGKAIQFYLHIEDEKLIREFAVWLAPHRKRINDSLVIKAVLRAAKTGPGLLAAYDDALTVDGRSKTRKAAKQQS